MKSVRILYYFAMHLKKFLRVVLARIAPLIKDDETFIRLRWKLCMDYTLNLENPKTYNEKLQWLKLHDRKPDYSKMVDKYEVKLFVEGIIGREYVVPTLGVYDSVDDIDLASLPNQFVLKCTSDSGGISICRDKSHYDFESAKKKLKRTLKRNYYFRNREWPYKNVKPRIIAEQYMEDESGELRDYKIFCFDGVPKAMFIATDRFDKREETKFDFFDMDFKHLPFTNGHPNATQKVEKPRGFEKMKLLAAQLSQGIPHVRVDFYDIKGRVYFGEMTFFHWSGMKPFEPIEWDCIFGSWIKLPNKE